MRLFNVIEIDKRIYGGIISSAHERDWDGQNSKQATTAINGLLMPNLTHVRSLKIDVASERMLHSFRGCLALPISSIQPREDR
jgi:hypothetical protein